MKYKIFNAEKIKLRRTIFLSILIVGICSVIVGIIFDILFLKILFLICIFCLWIPFSFSKNKIAGTINFNDTGITISLQNESEVNLSFADIQHISMNYQGYKNEVRVGARMPYLATGINVIKIKTKEKKYNINFLIEKDSDKQKFLDYVNLLDENNVSHSTVINDTMTKQKALKVFVISFLIGFVLWYFKTNSFSQAIIFSLFVAGFATFGIYLRSDNWKPA